MKRLVTIIALVFSFVIIMSCQQATSLTMSGPRSYSFTRDGGSQSFTFTCNSDWSISTTESWISTSPSSGSVSDGYTTVTIKCEPNATYDSRTATLTVRVEDLAETITINQDTGIGLIASPTTFDLTNAEQTIEIEVQKNVQYTVAIDDASSSWIKQGGTKALSTDKVTFTIAANTSYDNREGKIVFKQLDGSLSETIKINQAYGEGLIVEEKNYEVEQKGGLIEVNVKANVDYEVTPEVDWIHILETKGLSSSIVSIMIDENDSYLPREGTVTIKQKNGILSNTLSIFQAQKIAVVSVELDKDELFLKIGETATIKAAISPSNATAQTVSWSTSDESIAIVDDAGTITALSRGMVIISASVQDKEVVCPVYVDCIPNNEIWYTTIDERPLTFQSYNWGAMPEIISNVYSEGKVRLRLKSAPTEFTEHAFYGQFNLKTIILPETVTALGWGSFNECNNLESISLPANLKTIGANAFGVCESLKEITLPDSVDSIAEGVFQGCTSLTKINSRLAKDDGRTIVIEGTLVAVAWAGLSSYKVPDGVTRIGNSVFSHFSHMGSRMLKSVSLPSGLKSIGNYAFQEAPITNIVIPDSVESIESSAFCFCWDLASVTLPNSLTQIENGVFDGCLSLGAITLPSQLERIGSNSFSGTSLNSIVIPETVTFIGHHAFSGCSSLESIYLRPLIPPVLEVYYSYSDPFVYTNCPIYVPFDAITAYQTADIWNYYYLSRLRPYSE